MKRLLIVGLLCAAVPVSAQQAPVPAPAAFVGNAEQAALVVRVRAAGATAVASAGPDGQPRTVLVTANAMRLLAWRGR